jgi:iron-sulfur cluster repair protein YtfE (RIC family)
LPGETAIFRDKSLDFCRGGGLSRVGAARANGLSVYALEIDLDHIATTGRAPEHRP